MTTLNRDSPVPYYHQLKAILIEQIMALKDAQQPVLLPTEKDLQEKYQVSRSVVRQAVQELVQEGVVVREQGRGTFALPNKLRHNPQPEKARSHGLSGYMKERGIAPNTRLLSREAGHASAEAVLALERDLLPASLHFETPNPHIAFDDLNLAVAARALPLPRNGAARYAGVNSFGFELHAAVAGLPIGALEGTLSNRMAGRAAGVAPRFNGIRQRAVRAGRQYSKRGRFRA